MEGGGDVIGPLPYSHWQHYGWEVIIVNY